MCVKASPLEAAFRKKIRAAQALSATRSVKAPETPAERHAPSATRADERLEMRALANEQRAGDRTIRDGGGEQKADERSSGRLLAALYAAHPNGDRYAR